jgi:hypothetical protein
MTAEQRQSIQVADNYLAMWRSLRRDAFLARMAGRDAGDIKRIEQLAKIAHTAALAEQRLSEPTYKVDR